MGGSKIVSRMVLEFDFVTWKKLKRLENRGEFSKYITVEKYIIEAVKEKLKREIKKERVCKILRFAPEKGGDWVKVFYKVPRGRNVYSCFVMMEHIKDGRVNLPWFKGVKECI